MLRFTFKKDDSGQVALGAWTWSLRKLASLANGGVNVMTELDVGTTLLVSRPEGDRRVLRWLRPVWARLMHSWTLPSSAQALPPACLPAEDSGVLRFLPVLGGPLNRRAGSGQAPACTRSLSRWFPVHRSKAGQGLAPPEAAGLLSSLPRGRHPGGGLHVGLTLARSPGVDSRPSQGRWRPDLGLKGLRCSCFSWA